MKILGWARLGIEGTVSQVWILEMIGKGHVEKGAVWVAVRVPDGHVSGHANQARIQQFPLHDADHCVYSSDAGSPGGAQITEVTESRPN